jgi:AcrR family transcriptional regulator
LPSAEGVARASSPPDPETLPPAQRARRDRIVVAAIELLDAAAYEDVQMRDVAERAGVALGTIYRYFSSKEHLYAAALLAWSSDYGQPRRAASLDDLDDEARLRTLLRRAVRPGVRALAPDVPGAVGGRAVERPERRRPVRHLRRRQHRRDDGRAP